MAFQTRLTSTLPCRIPFVGASMAGGAGGALAAAVTKAGGFGFIANGKLSREFIDRELDIARRALGHTSDGARLPIGMGFIAWLLDTQPELSREVVAAVAPQVTCIWLSFGDDLRKWYDLVRASCSVVKVAIVASTPEDAVTAASWGADIIIVQSVEAGGHGLGKGAPLISLLPAVLDVLPSENRPVVVAAGGIATGAQAAAALALGADGFVVGTRLMATPEALGYSQAQKEVLVKANYDATVRTDIYDDVRGTTGWPEGVDGRAVRNKTYEEHVAGREFDEIKADFDTAVANDDVSRTITWSGTSVASVKSVTPAEDVVREFARDVAASIGRLGRIIA